MALVEQIGCHNAAALNGDMVNGVTLAGTITGVLGLTGTNSATTLLRTLRSTVCRARPGCNFRHQKTEML
jgi:hypothetical protein